MPVSALKEMKFNFSCWRHRGITQAQNIAHLFNCLNKKVLVSLISLDYFEIIEVMECSIQYLSISHCCCCCCCCLIFRGYSGLKGLAAIKVSTVFYFIILLIHCCIFLFNHLESELVLKSSFLLTELMYLSQVLSAVLLRHSFSGHSTNFLCNSGHGFLLAISIFTLLPLSHLGTALAVCLGLLSCWKTQFQVLTFWLTS